MTLQQIEGQIRACQRLEYVTYGPPTQESYPRGAEIGGVPAAIEGLYSAWATLRRTLWSGPYRRWARELADECRTTLERLSGEHGLVYFGEPDRFPGYTDSGGNFHAPVH
ncbi:MAG TPA: hypothetical protein VKY26_05230 [Actinomycetota bacterium]|nr:hypothetical protein [Actinomycetota bacterium]